MGLFLSKCRNLALYKTSPTHINVVLLKIEDEQIGGNDKLLNSNPIQSGKIKEKQRFYMDIFKARKVSKEIAGVKVLQDISLCVSQGETIAIKGTNGSGKSSLIKLIGGIYEPSYGNIERAEMNIGYVPEHFPENIRFSINDYLHLIAKISGKLEQKINKKIESYVDVFAIGEFLQTPLRKCSKGTKQKVGIIQALLKEPDLILLDEPLTGLDQTTQSKVIKLLQAFANNTTIILTTHEQVLISELAPRIIEVDKGKIISNSFVEIKEKLNIIKAKVPQNSILQELTFIDQKLIEENTVEVKVPFTESDKVLKILLEQGCSIIELKEMR